MLLLKCARAAEIRNPKNCPLTNIFTKKIFVKMKTSICVVLLYLTSMSIVMTTDNVISASCKDLLLKILNDLRFNWIVYAANLFSVIYIVSLAINESKRNEEEENCQEMYKSIPLKIAQLAPKHTTERKTSDFAKPSKDESTTEEETCKTTDDEDSGISTNGSKENNVAEDKRGFCLPKDNEQERCHKELVSQIQSILGAEQAPKDVMESDSFWEDSREDDIHSTPQQNIHITNAALMCWSESSCEISEADLTTDKLETIEEESSWKTDADTPSLHQEENPVNCADLDVQGRPESIASIPEVKETCQDERRRIDVKEEPHPFTFSKPYNLLNKQQYSEGGHHDEVKISITAQMASASEDYHGVENASERQLSDDEQIDTREDDPDSSMPNSFADLVFKFSPGFLYHSSRTNNSPISGRPSDSFNDESQFNTTFSVSSMEDILSPQKRRRTASPNRIPLDQSDDPDNPRFLGIRLHKPAGFKDVYLSIITIDEEKGLEAVSETWTLGNREDMELILSIETNPQLSTNKQYCGRYSLVFNDNGESLMTSTGEDSRMTRNDALSSFLMDRSVNDAASRQEGESFVETSAPEESFMNKLSTSGFGRLVWRVASQRRKSYDTSRDTIDLQDASEEYNEADDYYVNSELLDNIDSTSTVIVTRLRDISREWISGVHVTHTAMAVGCVALTCYVLYRST